MTRPELRAFEAMLDARGAAPDAWPASLRGDALDLVAEDPEARALWHATIALEQTLDAWSVPEADPDLALRIAAAAPDRARGDVLALPRLRWWQGAVFAALPLLLGFLIAVTQVRDLPRGDDHRAIEAELAHISTLGLLPEASRR